MTEALAPELQLGPRDFLASERARRRACSLTEAQAYTRWLATHHYENFHVVSIFLPRRLRQDFYNVYAYCRWADDLGDEIGEKRESLRLLDWWSGELDRMYEGQAEHPVFVALRGTVERHGIPKQPFADLIRAFILDQQVSRYPTWDAVLDYCRYSANPVGRLVLYLCGYSDAARQSLSDATCTALQLANFWQDVTVDLKKDRVYIPLEVMERHNYPVDDLLALRFRAEFREVMRECVDRAQALFEEGLPLAGMVNGTLALDLDLFSRGGMRVLEHIRARGFDVLSGRPAISRTERIALLAQALVRLAFRRAA
jgi:squalene synthase HpnC